MGNALNTAEVRRTEDCPSLGVFSARPEPWAVLRGSEGKATAVTRCSVRRGGAAAIVRNQKASSAQCETTCMTSCRRSLRPTSPDNEEEAAEQKPADAKDIKIAPQRSRSEVCAPTGAVVKFQGRRDRSPPSSRADGSVQRKQHACSREPTVARRAMGRGHRRYGRSDPGQGEDAAGIGDASKDSMQACSGGRICQVAVGGICGLYGSSPPIF